MPSQHKHAPISLRLPAGDRAWLLARAAATGQPVNAVLTEALAEYRAAVGCPCPAGMKYHALNCPRWPGIEQGAEPRPR